MDRRRIEEDNDRLIVVMAHGEKSAQATFCRHLPFWRAHELPMLVFSPEDNPVTTGITTIKLGKASHHSAEANKRFRLMLDLLYDFPQHRFVFFEYDSICLDRRLPLHPKAVGVFGNVFNNSDPKFAGSQFVHPPLMFNRETIGRILKSCRNIPDSSGFGFWDRWLGLVCDQGRIPMYSYGPAGYSENTIPEGSALARDAVSSGAVMIHGIKTAGVLDMLVDARQARNAEPA